MDADPGTPGPAAGGLQIPPVVLKILITVAAGAVTYVVTNVIDQTQQELWQIALAVVIGGATLIVQYMVDFERRLGAVEEGQWRGRDDQRRDLAVRMDEMTAMVDQGFRQVGEATELFGRLKDSQIPSVEVRRLIESATRVGVRGEGFLHRFARDEITRLARTMAEVDIGRVDLEGESNDTLIGLTKCAADTISTTSSFVDLAFWETATSRYYLAEQRSAIQRGVRVKRLFIVEDFENHLLNSKLTRFLEEQRSAGIEVGVVALSALSLEIRGDRTPEFVIFDDQLIFEMTTDVRQSFPNTRIDVREDYVRRQVGRFAHLWGARLEGPPA